MSTFMEHVHRDIDEAALWRPLEYDSVPADNRSPEGRVTEASGVHADAVDVIGTERFVAFDSRPLRSAS